MPSLSPISSTFRRRAVRTLIAMIVLAALVALPRVRAATTQTAPDGAQATASTDTASAPKAGKNPTCQAIMQRLSGSLAGTPSQAGGKKTAAVLVDVDKAGVTMACSHSDAVAIPVPASGAKTR
ncbi:glycoprotein [Ralstonia solanacearum]|uniref:glycoprotein n=1 Tax=Ralstonia solanacearum TaxID=305 RepID=UPI00078D69A8|nr:glycoprotein [Ralstonia solanacearum]AMP40117.1 glycoprotein [Ralstonia solanacearum]AXV88969.1 glycoprotein [Ralstonia solanacearum]AXW08435.1 glycoprotein [Ralstonia solanacearum]AXW26222.1 glycoprotein [Ralstonia solanacearum]AXW64330.1 glycoprotein [Ralstonia solanacearum]